MANATSNTVNARPTKRFFVSMLTRDIDLRDAILDLIDNCIDGVLRCIKKTKPTKPKGKPDEKPYAGYEARITATPKKFEIRDNCGGISRKIAEEKAFRMGRPEGTVDELIETVGFYGIGMKRAIFKLGNKSRVYSQHEGDSFEVSISPEWLSSDKEWMLPLEDAEGQDDDGITITVEMLHEQIQRQFDDKNSAFLVELVKLIGQLFSVIIGKGFKILVNGRQVIPVEVKLLSTAINDKKSEAINPYIYRGRHGDVEVEVIVGFYRPLASESEAEEALDAPQPTRDRAGWSIICNDRLVLYADKSSLTGWGIGSVPGYHGQFISIAGVVTFHSAKPELLPVNTTKRGLDTSSALYFTTLNYMMEGLKLFTDFTNKWKTKEKDSEGAFKSAQVSDPVKVSGQIPNSAFKSAGDGKGADTEGKVFKPKLPMPKAPEKTAERIVFSRPIREVKIASKFLFDEADRHASEVGGECFDYVVREARSR